MEYQKIVNLLDNTQNEESKFKTRNWFEINDESQGTLNASNQTKFKTTLIKYVIIVMPTSLLVEL